MKEAAESCLPFAGKRICSVAWQFDGCFEEFKNWVRRPSAKRAQFLCNTSPPIRQWMLDNFLAEEKETPGNRKVILQKDADNTIYGTCA